MGGDKERLRELYQQLAEVEKEREQVNLRLKEMAPGAARRNMGCPGGRGHPLRREGGGAGDGRTGPSGRGMGAPYGGPRGMADHGDLRKRPAFGDRAERRAPGPGAPGVRSAPRSMQDAPRRRLASAVVVAGETVTDGQEEPQDDAMEDRHDPGEADARPTPGIGKRPAPIDLEEKPDVKKRNRRMFGALLGTLQQFRKEDAKFKQSDAAVKRQEALKKAEAKVEETTRELRTKQREDHIAKKQIEMERKKMLILKGDRMRAEINFHRRVEHRQKLVHFIFTNAEPPLLWLPKKHTTETEDMLAQQTAGLDAWIKEEEEKMQAEQAELDAGIAELEEAMKARAEKEAKEGKEAEANGAQSKGEVKAEAADEPMGDKAEREEGEVPEDSAAGNGRSAPSSEHGSEPEELEEPNGAEELDELLS